MIAIITRATLALLVGALFGHVFLSEHSPALPITVASDMKCEFMRMPPNPKTPLRFQWRADCEDLSPSRLSDLKEIQDLKAQIETLQTESEPESAPETTPAPSNEDE